MKLIAHIGAPKTATTHIQAILSANASRIEAAGYQYVGPRHIRKTDHWKRIFRYYRGKARLEDIENIGDPYRGHEKVLLSEESITHDLMPQRTSDGGFGRVEESANILEKLGADEIHVVLAIRRQDHFLASTYAHFVHRQGLSLSPEHWFQRAVEPSKLSWQAVIEVLERRFGRDNLTIIPFDQARKDFPGYIAQVLAPTGIDPSDWTFRAGDSNPSLSRTGIDLARVINERAPTDPKRRRQVINAIIREYPAADFGRFNLDDTGIPRTLAKRYDDENRTVGARWFPEHADALGFEDWA